MTIRVNIKHRVNNAAIKREKRNGRDVVVVPSAVAKFDTVLNGIFYGEQELRESYQQINDLPAPLGHPVVNGQYVSARNPEAINQFWSGAWNTNARIEGDRVMADKIVDVEYAQNSENGRRLMEAINQGEPISTSTGLLMEREPAPEDAEYDYVGTNFMFDHDAILLNSAPAITPEEGVGMMVNGEQVDVLEAELNEELPYSMEDMRHALQRAAEEKYGNGFVDDFNAESLIFFQMDDDKTYKIGYGVVDGEIQLSDERQEVQRKTTWEAVTNSIRNTLCRMFGSMPDAPSKAAGLNVNSNEDRHMTPEELKAELDKQAEAINQKVEEATKPLKEKIETLEANQKAEEEAAHSEAVQAVVNASLMEEEEAKELPTKALNALVKTSKKAAPLAPGMASNSGDDETQFDTLPE